MQQYLHKKKMNEYKKWMKEKDKIFEKKMKEENILEKRITKMFERMSNKEMEEVINSGSMEPFRNLSEKEKKIAIADWGNERAWNISIKQWKAGICNKCKYGISFNCDAQCAFSEEENREKAARQNATTVSMGTTQRSVEECLNCKFCLDCGLECLIKPSENTNTNIK